MIRSTPGPGTVFVAVTLVVSLGLTPRAARAEPVAWTSAWGGAAGPRLQMLDLETGEATEVGPYGLPDATEGLLAFGPSGTLYATDVGQQRLLTLDPATGEATVVGGFGIPLFGIFGFTADASGRLWATGTPTGGAEPLGLYSIDPTTGQASFASELPPPLSGLSACGDQLIAIVYGEQAQVARIDPETGAVSELLPLDGIAQIVPLSLDLAPDGDLWSIGALAIPIDPLPSVLFRIAPDGSSETTQVGYFYYLGLAIAPPGESCALGSPLAIPTASPLGLTALALLLACAGVLALLRPRRSARTRAGHSP